MNPSQAASRKASRLGTSFIVQKQASEDPFSTALKAKLEDVQTHCKNEVSRLAREVSHLHRENAELRHILTTQESNHTQPATSSQERVSNSARSSAVASRESRTRIVDNNEPPSRNALDVPVKRRSKPSATSPVQRRMDYFRRSSEITKTSMATRQEPSTKLNIEPSTHVMPSQAQENSEMPSQAEQNSIALRRAGSWDSKREQSGSSASQMRSQKRCQSSPAGPTSPAQVVPAIRISGTDGNEAEPERVITENAEMLKDSLSRISSPAQSCQPSKPTVSEAAALAVALVTKSSSQASKRSQGRLQSPSNSDDDEDIETKSRCSDDDATSNNAGISRKPSKNSTVSVRAASPVRGPAQRDMMSNLMVQPIKSTKSTASVNKTRSTRSNQFGTSSSACTNSWQPDVMRTPSEQSRVPSCILAARAATLRRQESKGFEEAGSRESVHSALFYFEPLPHWTRQTVRRKRMAKTRRSINLCNDLCKETGMSPLDSIQQQAKPVRPQRDPCISKFMSKYLMTSPTTMRCIVFDLIGVVLIGYEIIFLPLQVFDMPRSVFISAMDWIQRIFWTLAIFRSFCTGYVVQDGNIEVRPGRVARNYITGWLAFDLLVMVFDWAEMIMAGSEFVSATRITKTIRFTRMVRIFRLARMAKLPRLLEDFDARFISERTILMLGIVKITLLFAIVGHLLACFWYGLGRYWSYDNRGWVHSIDCLRESLAYQYTTSLHWALTQFQGSMEVMPQNTYERNYACWVLVFSFVSASVFVSRITAAYTRLQIIAGGHERKFSELRVFLQSHSISSSLAMRVMRSAQFAVNQSIRETSEEEIELLAHITEPLRIEIHYEIFRPHLCVHPFFRWINHANGGAMRHLCQSAVQVLHVSQGDLLFSEGQEAMNPRMLFVMSGQFVYNSDFDETVVGKGAWFSEGTLWLQWVHVGDLTSVSEGQIVALKSDCFQETMSKFYDLAEICVKYAAAYVKTLNSCPAAICDLHRGFQFEELMEQAVGNSAKKSGGIIDRLSGGLEKVQPYEMSTGLGEIWSGRFSTGNGRINVSTSDSTFFERIRRTVSTMMGRSTRSAETSNFSSVHSDGFSDQNEALSREPSSHQSWRDEVDSPQWLSSADKGSNSSEETALPTSKLDFEMPLAAIPSCAAEEVSSDHSSVFKS